MRMRLFFLIFFLLVFSPISLVRGQVAYHWDENFVDPGYDFGWKAEASSADGTYLIAAVSGRGLYFSSNKGQTWAETGPSGSGGGVSRWWSSVDISSDGRYLVVAANSGRMYVSNDFGDNWTEIMPAGSTDKKWMSVSISDDGTHIAGVVWAGRVYVSSDSGSSWQESRPAGDVNKNWWAISVSADGEKLAVGNSYGRVYVSNNFGNSWAETMPAGNTDYSWRIISLASDGEHLLLGNSFGRLYYSSDFGSDWTEIRPVGDSDQYWKFGSVSSDGTRLVAGINDVESGSHVYVSSDLGNSWQEIFPAGEGSGSAWNTTSISADGSFLMVGAAFYSDLESRLYISSNSGVDWSETRPTVDADKGWFSAAASEDGTYVVASTFYGEGTGPFYVSSDSGQSWEIKKPFGDVDGYWISVSVSDSGAHMAASSYDGSAAGVIYLSSDYGASWYETIPTNERAEYWNFVTMSGDGAHLVAGGDEGRLYVSSDFGTNWKEVLPLGDQDVRWIFGSTSTDGKRIFAGVKEGRLYYSSDFGENWVELRPMGDTDQAWNSGSMSSNGNQLFVTGYVYDDGSYHIYKSIDSGLNWEEVKPDGDQEIQWSNVAMSGNGEEIAIGAENGHLYGSSDYGVSWEKIRPIGDDWHALAFSRDGSFFIAGEYGGTLQTALINAPINQGPTSDEFILDVNDGFLSFEGSDPASTPKVTFNTDYTITSGDAQIIFPAGTEMTNSQGGNLNLTEMDVEDITNTLKNTNTSTIAGALTIGIPNLRLSFSKTIQVTIPVDSSYDGQTLNIWYQNSGESNWTQGPTCTVSEAKCVFETDHATSYSAGDQPTGTIQTKQKAKIDSWKAYQYTDNSKCVSRLKLEIKGHHFDKRAEVKIGSQKASSTNRKSSRQINAIFCMDRLLDVKTDLERKITVKNPETNSTRAKERIYLKTIFAKFSVADFSTQLSAGIKNIQQALVKLGLLKSENVTGFYDSQTVQAVKNFQTDKGLPTTGFVGPLTKEWLQREYEKAL